MNVNWREAILSAQKKIDKVLDIRPEEESVEEHQPLDSSSTSDTFELADAENNSEASENEVVVLEPVLPPFFHNHSIAVGDEIQTIISSDIEHLTRNSSRTVSPKPQTLDFDAEIIGEDVLDGLKTELNEYKKENQLLKESHAKIEREMEENKFQANQQVVSMLREERSHFDQEVGQLKKQCTEFAQERRELENKNRAAIETILEAKSALKYFKSQMVAIKSGLGKAEEMFDTEMKKVCYEVEKSLEASKKKKKFENKPNYPEISSVCNCKENNANYIDEYTQTENNESTQQTPSEPAKKEENPSSPEKCSGNVKELLQIIEQLEWEKEQFLAAQKRDQIEIEQLRDQLNETLIMHGEKIELLDELKVDNEELKYILKQQALQLTNNL